MLTSEPPLVGLQNAGLQRSGRWLVRGVDLSVQRGEIVTMIGPNGSGKSTTARLALGLVRPDEGTARKSPTLRVGYVPQTLAIDWTLPLTVGRFMNLTERLPVAATAAALERTGVGHLQGAAVRSLSGGEFQRVQLARALARTPDLLVLDEPVQGVDINGGVALYRLIGELRDELNCGVLLISHDLHVVMAATDRVLCLNGHVCCEGAPGHVLESPEYRALFGDQADATLALYRHTHDHEHLPDGTVCAGHGHDHAHDHAARGSANARASKTSEQRSPARDASDAG